jgi:hypothetical protein
MPFGIEGLLGSGYLAAGQPQRAVDCYRTVTRFELGPVGNLLNAAGMAMALTALGEVEAAVSSAERLLGPAQLARNPYVEGNAQLAYAISLALPKPQAALDAVWHGLQITRESGNRAIETFLTSMLGRLTVHDGDPLAVLNGIAMVNKRLLGVGNLSILRNNLAILAGLFERLDRDATAARILGFAVDPFVSASIPEIEVTIANLRGSLGDENLEAFMREGAATTKQAMVEFVEREIDSLRATITSGAQPSQDDH